MRLICVHELHGRNLNELSQLFRQVSQGLPRTERGSPERRNALASLENISRERCMRLQEPRR